MSRSKYERKICQVRGCQTPWRSTKTQRCHKHRDTDCQLVPKPVLPVECTTPRCPNPVLRPGRCNSCQYAQYQKLQPETIDMIETGLMHWIVPSEDGCWLYENQPMWDRGGYGKFRPDGRWAQVHKWLFMHLAGPVPDGYQLHHSCTVRNCCRPGHLTPVTPEEHKKLTAADMAFRAMYPDEKITGPDRSHTDRERRFALVWALPADTILTASDFDELDQEPAAD